jgi:hypothetical protein
MSPSPAARLASLNKRIRSTLVIAAAVPLAAAMLACGGPSAPAADATSVTASHTGAGTGATGSAMLTASPGSGSKKAERRTNPAWAPCHATFTPDAKVDLPASVDQLAKGCLDTTKMHMQDSFKGTQAATGLPQAFGFHAESGHCYRAYAVAGPGIQDLDLLIKDSTGAVAGEDSTDDPSPVVQEDGAVCFGTTDSASVVVSIGAGSGAYAVQVWSD